MSKNLSNGTVTVDSGNPVAVGPLSLRQISAIGHQFRSELTPVVRGAIGATLGQVAPTAAYEKASQRLLAKSPEIIDAIIEAGTFGLTYTETLSLGVKAQLLGTIIRSTLDALSPMQVATALIMPNLGGASTEPTVLPSPNATVN